MKHYLLLTLLFVATFAMLGCGGEETPEQAFEKMKVIAENNDFGGMYDRFHPEKLPEIDKGIDAFLGMMSLNPAKKSEIDALKDKSSRDKFIYMLQGMGEDGMKTNFGKIIESKVEGDLATLKVERDGGSTDVVFKKHEGQWMLYDGMK